MTKSRVIAGSVEYDFVPDDTPRITDRTWAIATAQLIDEISEEPVHGPFRVQVEQSLVAVKLGDDGTFCLVARPGRRFPPFPGPRPIVRAHIHADGFILRDVQFTVPFDVRTIAAPAPAATATVVTLSTTVDLNVGQWAVLGAGVREEFVIIGALGPGANQITLLEPLKFGHPIGDPAIPATRPAARIELHRKPVGLRGRVVRVAAAGGPPTPVPNATVTLADFWRTRQDVRTSAIVGGVPVGAMRGPAPNMFGLALAQGVIVARPAGATAGTLSMTPAALEEKRLLAGLDPGDTALRLSSRRNVIATSLLRIGKGDAQASEIRTVTNVVGLGGPDDAAVLTVDFPMLRSQAAGTRVDRMVPAAALLPLTFRAAAEVGDCTVLIDALPAAPVEALQIRSPGITDEYHDCNLYIATSDIDGYFRLPPLHRAAQVRLDVDDGLAPAPFPFFIEPDYDGPEQWIDLRIQ
jgi:hypothetical protein